MRDSTPQSLLLKREKARRPSEGTAGKSREEACQVIGGTFTTGSSCQMDHSPCGTL